MVALRTLEALRVAGLYTAVWRGSGPTVLGLPGLGSSSRAWALLADALPDANVVAPDLRGRGGSAGLGGPTGLRQHARDMKAVADELDLRDIIVVGHSMGAYLAPVVADEIGDRVARLVLLDGGIPPRLPVFMRPAVVRTTFRRNLRKVDRDWPDAESFAKTATGKALRSRPDLLPIVASWGDHELAGPPGALRPRLDAAHVVADAVDTFFGGDVVPALLALTVPAHLIAATAGKHDRARPFLSEKVVDEWTDRLPALSAERVHANHVTLLFAPEVTQAVSR
jgi:lipase